MGMDLKITIPACLLLINIGSVLPSTAAPAESVKRHPQAQNAKSASKSSHKLAQARHRKIAYYGKNFLVPPPPPYTPSMLPELQYARYSSNSQKQESPEEENPYSKYIYTRPGYEPPPKPAQPNKYVTYWANKT
jgi:hypothetical protein